MKSVLSLVALASLGWAAAVVAAELKSGPSVGAPLAPFEVVKVAGAVGDGVDQGEELCYRCKYGSRPMVMVFTRAKNDGVAKLAKKLDATVAAHKAQKLAAFVNFVGGERSELEKAAKSLGSSEQIEHVALVVPVESEDGPADYRLSADADVTVLLCAQGKVMQNIALEADSLSDNQINDIIAGAEKLLN